MTVVAPPFFFEFIQWITEQANKEEAKGSWQPPRQAGVGMPNITIGDLVAEPIKRKVNAYNRRYGRAFKKCKSKHMKKNGTWKKGGFKRCVKEAHRMAKK
jgi:hypothetical protein